jgi:hypothetical protein
MSFTRIHKKLAFTTARNCQNCCTICFYFLIYLFIYIFTLQRISALCLCKTLNDAFKTPYGYLCLFVLDAIRIASEVNICELKISKQRDSEISRFVS